MAKKKPSVQNQVNQVADLSSVYAAALQQAQLNQVAQQNATTLGMSASGGYTQTIGNSNYVPQMGGAGGAQMGGYIGGNTVPLPGNSWQVPNLPNQYQRQTATPIGMLNEEQIDSLAGVVLKRVMDALKHEDKEQLRKLLRGKV